MRTLPPHGTIARYEHKCRCIDCRVAAAEWFAAYRGCKSPRGIILHLDIPSVVRIMRDKRIGIEDVCAAVGYKRRTVEQWLKTGGISIYCADELACALGTHYSLIVQDDVVSVA